MHNGPAVEGVNVTRRSHPATYPGSLAGICPGGEEGMPCPGERSEVGGAIFAPALTEAKQASGSPGER